MSISADIVIGATGSARASGPMWKPLRRCSATGGAETWMKAGKNTDFCSARAKVRQLKYNGIAFRPNSWRRCLRVSVTYNHFTNFIHPGRQLYLTNKSPRLSTSILLTLCFLLEGCPVLLLISFNVTSTVSGITMLPFVTFQW